MTQDGMRIYLIEELMKEMPEYRNLKIPDNTEGQKRLLCSLMNIRPPVPAAPGFLKVQDAYLSREIEQGGIVDGSLFQPVRLNSRMYLWKGDITRLRTDAIVNAANSAMLGCFLPGHTCIDNVIHTFAGVQLRLKCHEIMKAQGHEEPVGAAKITPGYNLPCRYVLHTVGPAISGPLSEQDCEQLAGCYYSCLELAAQNNIKSIAFCCISTGVFQFPQDEAARIAVNTVAGFLEQNDSVRQVIFNVFTDKDYMLYRELLERQE
ncbi:protein-ADP-ribose hydrolase [Ruminococcus sp. OA3]|uniref:protein-ADP-ribose hydrolase n=1 Tax=Ruminococcus sp. OA3 TaxID=2914164 RepID=UPI001F062AC7|nr:protein-ADP-ribose hydrolase [Ruminococcus sp. OA3]MCH1984357.1 protein-ADP-ribose hydrolase [Ruminococcus sp. OA3]